MKQILRQFLTGLAVVLGILFGSHATDPFTRLWAQEKKSPAEVTPSPQSLEEGRKIYMKWCVNCHGPKGKGDGPASGFVNPKPRNFTPGTYKFRSTPSGELATNEDLFRTISMGLNGTAMPAWGELLNERERWQLVHYIKTFYPKYDERYPQETIKIGKPVPPTEESIARGKELYNVAQCWECHGQEGRGDGPSMPGMTDDAGDPIRPANLTKAWRFKRGDSREDIYVTLSTGLSGSPMPSFVDVFPSDEQRWDLANYVRSLSPEKKPELEVVIKAKRVFQEIPLDLNDPVWNGVKQFGYPLVGQVIQEPRLFTPSVDSITVQAVYNDREIAFRLVWDDPTASQPNPDEGIFEDAVAVQFPVQIPTESQRPYFLMGNSELAVYLMKWSASGGSGSQSVTEIIGNGLDKLAPLTEKSGGTQAVGEFKNGQYKAVMKRPLTTADEAQDTQFEPGRFIPIAFFVWDGSNGETGSRMAISHWYYLLIEPPLPPKVYVYPIIAVVATAVMQWWTIRRLQRQ